MKPREPKKQRQNKSEKEGGKQRAIKTKLKKEMKPTVCYTIYSFLCPLLSFISFKRIDSK
jgi:hypothetical protein